jgi:hypothetical protein
MVTAFGHISVKVSEGVLIVTPPKPPGSIKQGDELIERL